MKEKFVSCWFCAFNILHVQSCFSIRNELYINQSEHVLFMFFVVDIILILYVCICLFYLFVIGKKVKYTQCFDSLCLTHSHSRSALLPPAGHLTEIAPRFCAFISKAVGSETSACNSCCCLAVFTYGVSGESRDSRWLLKGEAVFGFLRKLKNKKQKKPTTAKNTAEVSQCCCCCSEIIIKNKSLFIPCYSWIPITPNQIIYCMCEPLTTVRLLCNSMAEHFFKEYVDLKSTTLYYRRSKMPK